MRKIIVLWVLLIFVVMWTEPAAAATPPNSGPDLFSDLASQYLCPAGITRRSPYRCSSYSPGARQTRMEYLRAKLPDPLPTLAVEEIETPEGAITEYHYAYVRTLPAGTYKHPEEFYAGLPPMREFVTGDNWLSVIGELQYNNEPWYEINEGEFIKAEYIVMAMPSSYRGITLTEQPAYPFAWINRDVNPSATPGGEARQDVTLGRYSLITIFAQELLGDKVWYMVGTDQWVEQSFTARVDVDPLPQGVAPGEKWIEVNTYEQTLAAYEGERMVFATLISTGRSDTWTPDGLTRIWGKLATTPMQNRDVGPDNPAWYYLEDVTWTQYFNGAYALHSAYWHGAFGFTRSHGCVNLAILDAKWLFDWTTPYVAEGAKTAYSAADGPGAGTWVWVHKTGPFPGAE